MNSPNPFLKIWTHESAYNPVYAFACTEVFIKFILPTLDEKQIFETKTCDVDELQTIKTYDKIFTVGTNARKKCTKCMLLQLEKYLWTTTTTTKRNRKKEINDYIMKKNGTQS